MTNCKDPYVFHVDARHSIYPVRTPGKFALAITFDERRTSNVFIERPEW
jgi:hypothetical protein